MSYTMCNDNWGLLGESLAAQPCFFSDALVLNTMENEKVTDKLMGVFKDRLFRAFAACLF